MAVRRALQDRLNEIDVKIAKHQDQISGLEAKKQDIIDADKKAKVEKLVNVMEKNNISVEELLEKVKDD